MNCIYLRRSEEGCPVAMQEHGIRDFMRVKNIPVDCEKIDSSPLNRPIEEREDFKEFIHSLKEGDRIFVYDLRVFSPRVGELIQILNCIFEHNLTLVITKYGVSIKRDTPSHQVITLLNTIREENRGSAKIGRPKGSISRSKYDKHKEEIIKMIKEGKSVSEIAKELGYARSSIRDYISSRNLKEIALKKETLVKDMPKSECKISEKG